jgi:hypothetical protein
LTISGESGEVFSRIYRKRVWGEDGGGSGRGSTLENGKRTASVLHAVLDRFGLNSLLDAPCGAMVWTAPFIQARRAVDPTFTYTGVDVVATAIADNKARFAPEFARFETIDLATHAPPDGHALILCRDTLQHLSYAAIAGVLAGFAETDAGYLLTTTFSETGRTDPGANRDIETGGFFRVDLLAAPFGFTDGLIELYDDTRPTGFQKGHKLALYDLPELTRSPAFRRFLTAHGRA